MIRRAEVRDVGFVERSVVDDVTSASAQEPGIDLDVRGRRDIRTRAQPLRVDDRVVCDAGQTGRGDRDDVGLGDRRPDRIDDLHLLDLGELGADEFLEALRVPARERTRRDPDAGDGGPCH